MSKLNWAGLQVARKLAEDKELYSRGPKKWARKFKDYAKKRRPARLSEVEEQKRQERVARFLAKQQQQKP